MLQRIQTVWLILAFLCEIALFFVSRDVDAGWLNYAVGFLCGFSPVIILFSIINFKNRKRQILLNTISIIINALLIGLLAYWLLNLSGGISFPEKGIEPIFPILAIICLFIANMLIRRDERLVKSVDRLR